MSGEGDAVQIVEEEIVVKPAIELIADEYENVENVIVQIFSCNGKDGEGVKKLQETLKVADTNVHSLEDDDCLSFINDLGKKEDNSAASGLMCIFLGNSVIDGEIKISNSSFRIEDIAKKFTAQQCPHLKNKPKLFIFFANDKSMPELSGIERDGARIVKYEAVYDTPSEADLLIFYLYSKDSEISFVDELCDNIKQFGKSEEICTILNCCSSKSGIITSTLVKKFYFFPSAFREHNYVYQQTLIKINSLSLLKGKPKGKTEATASHGRTSSKSQNVTLTKSGTSKPPVPSKIKKSSEKNLKTGKVSAKNSETSAKIRKTSATTDSRRPSEINTRTRTVSSSSTSNVRRLSVKAVVDTRRPSTSRSVENLQKTSKVSTASKTVLKK